MPVTIGSNRDSLFVRRNLDASSQALSKTFERLSSGQRINRACDDAAGLSIATNLDVASRIYAQGIKNLNDGISYLAIADSALSELNNITTRRFELAEQAANGVFSKPQRQSIDAESDALVDEFNRIVKTTKFNDRLIIDAESSAQLQIQAGFGLNGSLSLLVGDELARHVGTGKFGEEVAFSTFSSRADITLTDINNDGAPDLLTTGVAPGWGKVTVQLNDGHGNFGTVTEYASERINSARIKLSDINSDGNLDLITAGDGDTGYGEVNIRLGNGRGGFGAATQYSSEYGSSYGLDLSDINGDGYLDLVTAGQGLSYGAATTRLNDGHGNFGAATQYSTESSLSYGVSLGDLNGDGYVDLVTAGVGGGGKASIRLNDGHGNFGSVTQYVTEASYSYGLALSDIDDDGDLDMVTAGKTGSGIGLATVRLNNSDGTFGSAIQYTTEGKNSASVSLVDINGDGSADLVTSGNDGSRGWITTRLNDGRGNFGASVQYETSGTEAYCATLGDLDEDGDLDLAATGAGAKLSLFKAIGHDVTTVLKTNLTTQAREALDVLSKELNRITSERGSIGAMQSRLDVAVGTLFSSRENSKAASSRITDADIAQETANMLKFQILQNVGASILAQANQSPALALRLLSSR